MTQAQSAKVRGMRGMRGTQVSGIRRESARRTGQHAIRMERAGIACEDRVRGDRRSTM